MHESIGCDRPGWIPQHEFERILHGLFSALGHDGTPSYWVQIVLRQIINRNRAGPVAKTKDTSSYYDCNY